jgi:hypothetical protein
MPATIIAKMKKARDLRVPLVFSSTLWSNLFAICSGKSEPVGDQASEGEDQASEPVGDHASEEKENARMMRTRQVNGGKATRGNADQKEEVEVGSARQRRVFGCVCVNAVGTRTMHEGQGKIALYSILIAFLKHS